MWIKKTRSLASRRSRWVRSCLLPDRLLDDLNLLVGQPVQFVHDLVDQVVGPLDLSLQFRGPLFRLDVARQPVANVVYGQPDEGMVLVDVTAETRRGARELLGKLDGDTAAAPQFGAPGPIDPFVVSLPSLGAVAASAMTVVLGTLFGGFFGTLSVAYYRELTA